VTGLVDVTVVGGTFARSALSALVLIAPASAPASAPATATAAPAVDLDPVRKGMKKLKPDNPRKPMIDAILKGESFAERGERDDAMYAAASTIAWLQAARRPEMTPGVLVELLRPSLEAWTVEPDADKTIEEEMEKALTKFESAFEQRAERDAEQEAERFKDANAIRRGLRFKGEEPTKEAVNGTARFFSIIQTSNASYIWNFAKGEIPYAPIGYHGPIKESQLFNVCKDFWENSSEGYSLRTYTKGEERNKGVKQILEEYGSAALKLEGNLTLQESFFDIETRTFNEAMCPFRVVQPERDPVIEEWLTLFGASNHEKLLDWIATIPQLEEPNSALYLEGVKDVGKDLFASGVARLWRTSGPALYERVSERFNKDMFECPFVWLNEGVDGVAKTSSTFIRRLISATGHSCERKGLDVQPVLGSIRLYIAANNENVLHSLASEDLGEADLDAVAQRFLHVKASPDAALYLESKKRDLKSWVKDDRIARHVLYLAQSRTVIAGRKFLVDGEQSDIHRALINRGDKNEIVLEWLTNLMESPERVLQQYATRKEQPLAVVGDGGVFVNTKGFVDHQTLFRTPDKKLLLLPGIASRILSRLSGGRQRRMGESRDRYHVINPERVFEWADRTQLGDIETMKANLSRPLKLESSDDY
jgi:hypothetical protein